MIDVAFSICVGAGLFALGLGCFILWIEHKDNDGKGEE